MSLLTLFAQLFGLVWVVVVLKLLCVALAKVHAWVVVVGLAVVAAMWLREGAR